MIGEITIKILEYVEKKVPVQSKAGFDPKEFYKKRDGLYVWSDFTERILPKAEPVKEAKDFALSSFKLLKDSSDEQIELSLPKEHIFSETDVCSIIASLIEKQPKGEEGALLNNGYANLFYTPAFVVRVRWYVGEWFVRTYERDGNAWGAGLRVFSPATES